MSNHVHRVPPTLIEPRSAVDTPTAIEEFLMAKVAAGFSVRTIEAYRHRLYRFRDWLGQRPLSRGTLRGYLASLQQDKRLGPVSVSMYFRDVGVWCRWLTSEGVIEENPAAGLRFKAPQRRPPSYSIDHLHRLFAVSDARDRAIIITLLDTGLRVSELTSLQRTTIDWSTGAFTVVGKGEKERVGWLSEPTLQALRVYLATRMDADPALWYGRTQALQPNGVHQAIKRRVRQAGLQGEVRRLLHSFRATFAKHYIQRGGDLESLRKLLGHSTIAMSAFYAQLADDELAAKKAAVNPLAAVLGETKKPDVQ